MDKNEKNPNKVREESDDERKERLWEEFNKELGEARDVFEVSDFIEDLLEPLEVLIPIKNKPLKIKFCRLSSSETEAIHNKADKEKLSEQEKNDLMIFSMISKAYPDKTYEEIRDYIKSKLPNQMANFAARYILGKASVFFTQGEELTLLRLSTGFGTPQTNKLEL